MSMSIFCFEVIWPNLILFLFFVDTSFCNSTFLEPYFSSSWFILFFKSLILFSFSAVSFSSLFNWLAVLLMSDSFWLNSRFIISERELKLSISIFWFSIEFSIFLTLAVFLSISECSASISLLFSDTSTPARFAESCSSNELFSNASFWDVSERRLSFKLLDSLSSSAIRLV